MGMGGFIGQINNTANHLNPFKGLTDWSTHHSLSYIPGVGKPLAQLADWGDSHPAQVGAAIGAGFGAAGYLGGAAAAGGGGASVGAGGLGAAGVGAEGGAAPALTSSGFGGVGMDGAVSGLDGASIDPALAGDSIDAGGGWSPASGGSSGFDWQGLLRRGVSQAMQQQGGGSGRGTLYQAPDQQTENADQASVDRQRRLALALSSLQGMQAQSERGQYSAPRSGQLSQAALAAYLMGMNK